VRGVDLYGWGVPARFVLASGDMMFDPLSE
jgi:hypothetical protein